MDSRFTPAGLFTSVLFAWTADPSVFVL